MSFESVIYSTLANDTALQTLCPRIYPQQPLDNVDFPFAWYRFTRSDRLYFQHVATGISDYTFEINCFHKTQFGVIGICNRVIDLLDGYTASPDVGFCKLDDENQKQRSDGYIYFVKSLKFIGMGV